jgi:hypothetical protein
MESRSRVIVAAPGGVWPWMNIGIAKSPAAKDVATCWRWARAWSRPASSVASAASSRITPPRLVISK